MRFSYLIKGNYFIRLLSCWKIPWFADSLWPYFYSSGLYDCRLIWFFSSCNTLKTLNTALQFRLTQNPRALIHLKSRANTFPAWLFAGVKKTGVRLRCPLADDPVLDGGGETMVGATDRSLLADPSLDPSTTLTEPHSMNNTNAKRRRTHYLSRPNFVIFIILCGEGSFIINHPIVDTHAVISNSGTIV